MVHNPHWLLSGLYGYADLHQTRGYHAMKRRNATAWIGFNLALTGAGGAALAWGPLASATTGIVALGLAGGQVVQPFSPCQVVVSVFSSDGAYDAGASLGTALMTFFDPHSTQLSSRTCLDCHLDPKSLGLGSGRLQRDAGPGVRPLYDAGASNFGWPVPPDRLVGIDGEPAQAFSGPDDRPLDAVELRGVLDVAPCLPCHGSYDDPLWTGYRAGRRLWRAGLASGCAFNAQALEAMDVQCDTSYRDNVSSMTAGFGPSMPRRENRVDNMLE